MTHTLHTHIGTLALIRKDIEAAEPLYMEDALEGIDRAIEALGFSIEDMRPVEPDHTAEDLADLHRRLL